MPRLADLQKVDTARKASHLTSDECLINDQRGGITPATMVDQKVFALLKRCETASRQTFKPR